MGASNPNSVKPVALTISETLSHVSKPEKPEGRGPLKRPPLPPKSWPLPLWLPPISMEDMEDTEHTLTPNTILPPLTSLPPRLPSLIPSLKKSHTTYMSPNTSSRKCPFNPSAKMELDSLSHVFKFGYVSLI